MENVEVICRITDFLLADRKEDAASILRNEYPHNYIAPVKRKLSALEKLRIFYRDGFIDRYSGKRLLFPNVLRMISIQLGDDLPFHKNWKMSECHIAYWELMPTYDHVFPVDRGGQDIPVNIVTTSQLNNSRKSNFLIDEIGFDLFPPGNIDKWDGKIGWYKKMIKKDHSILSDKYCFKWNNALEIIEKEKGT